MFSLRSVICLALLSSLVLALGGCATVATSMGKDDFNVSSGVLMRGTSDFTVKAIQVPGLCNSGGKLSVMAPALARIAEVGGNTVCFDLTGFNADGTVLDTKAVETVGVFAKRTKDQRMGAMIRVLGNSTDPAFRKNAVRTAAKALKNQGLAFYWMDGPDAAALAKEFKKFAPSRVVAAPKNGDIEVVEQTPAAKVGHPVLLAGSIPDFKVPGTHFVLPGKDADYPALDAALTNPVEKAPYTPDNSKLSEEERKQGFDSLFDGKTLNGWWFFGDNPKGFRVNSEGCIEWVEKGGGALYSRERYGDFTLRLEFKVKDEGSNSGVYLRAPRDARQSKIGMESQIMGDYGKEPDIHVTGAVYDVVAPKVNAMKKAGEWNTMEVVFQGPHLKTTINGKVVQDLSFEENEELRYRLRKGFIGLQDHDCYVTFRNIRIKKM